MKKIYSLFICLLLLLSSAAQAQDFTIYSYTENPQVQRQNKSKFGTSRITDVIVSNKAIIIHFEYLASQSTEGGGISMSSSAILKAGNTTIGKITNFGTLDENQEMADLNLDEQYDVEAGGQYNLYMVFPPADFAVENLSVYEDGYEGFYWENIQLNPFGSFVEEEVAEGDTLAEDSEIVDSVVNDEQEELAKFIVTDAKQNGVDLTPQIVSQNGTYTVFYTVGDQLYMANVCSKSDSQSWGEVYDFEQRELEETDSTYQEEDYAFSWHYQNSYDDKTGTCKCTFTKVYKPQGVVTQLKMVTETLDIIIYTGYMEGTVDLSRH